MAVRTVDSRLIVGTGAAALDLSPATTDWALRGQVTRRSHTALGVEAVDAVPTAAGHMLDATVFLDPEAMLPPESTLAAALVLPTAGLAAVGPMLLRARPLSLPRDDLVLAQIQMQPADRTLRCAQVLALKPTAGTVDLAAGDQVWVAATAAAAATVVVGGATTAVPKGGAVTAAKRPADGSGIAVTTTGAPSGWLLVGRPVTLGAA